MQKMNYPKTSAGKGAVVKKDLLASIVVFLVALPLCMGIAIASGAPVSAGLITGIIGGIVVGTLAGCPLQVSGPAAGLAVVVYEIIQRFGFEMLGLVVLMAGAIQVAAGVFRLGQWFRAVSPAVVKGMLAGIGVLIFASQFHVMVDDRPKGSGLENLATIPASAWKGIGIPEFGTRESRRSQMEALKAVGELHRQQVSVQERLAERAPRLPDHPEATAVEALELEPLEKPQAEIFEQLAGMMDQLRQLEISPDPEVDTPIRDAAKAALAANERALDTIRQDKVAESKHSQIEAVESLESLLGSLKHHSFAAELGLLTIIMILLWQGFAPRKLRIVPAPLVAVVVATTIAVLLTLPVLYVEVPTSLVDELRFPTLAILQNAPWMELLQVAILVAVVASAETLLSATAVDQLHSGPRTKYDKELWAQGVGNMCSGFVGGLPITGVIVRSSANVNAGATTRLSAVMHGIWLLIFVAGLAALLRMIPTAALAAILVYTGYKLVNIKSIRELRKYGWGEVGIYFATAGSIVIFDLLTGVIVGVVLAAIKLLYTFSHLNTHLEIGDDNKAVLQLEGAATFIRLPRLACKLEEVPQTAELHVDLQHLDYIDHACLDLLMNWAKQHESTGGKLVIDWQSLHAKFHADPNGKNGKKAFAEDTDRESVEGTQRVSV